MQDKAARIDLARAKSIRKHIRKSESAFSADIRHPSARLSFDESTAIPKSRPRTAIALCKPNRRRFLFCTAATSLIPVRRRNTTNCGDCCGNLRSQSKPHSEPRLTTIPSGSQGTMTVTLATTNLRATHFCKVFPEKKALNSKALSQTSF